MDIRNRTDYQIVESLTQRERAILVLLCESLSNQEIANRLYLSEKTVRWYNTQIFNKLGVSNRHEAVERAQALGLCDAASDALSTTGKHNLPAQSTPFVGRQRELDDLAALLDDANNRLITILAPGGMGKTRLAVEAARAKTGRCADGVYFVPVGPLNSADDIVTTIAESIGFVFQGETPAPQQLVSFLKDRKMLLVLDNFEHLLDGAPLVAAVVQAAPGVRVLITSRERLDLHSETVYTLRGLDFPALESTQAALDFEAIRLFVQVARHIHPEFKPQAPDFDAIAHICRLTAGMPLGIELAAGWVNVLSPLEIVDEIQRGIDILETDMRDVPERHRSIRATFERTWERLTDAEQQGFMRLSIFRGGFTTRAARVIAGADVRLLRKLVDKSLVQIAPHGRHDIHELLRQFGAEKLATFGEQPQIEAAHAEFFADFMAERRQEIKTDRQLEALDMIGSDFENVRAAWLYTIHRQAWDVLPKFLYSLWFYLQVRTRGQVGVGLLEAALEALRAEPLSSVTELARGRILARLGWFYNDTGFIDKAAVSFEEAVQILNQYDSPEDLLTALHGQQNVLTQAQWTTALNATQAGLSAARMIGDKHWEAHILIYAGLLDDVRKELNSARQYADEALAAFTQIGDRWGLMIACIALGRIHFNQSAYREARYWFRQAQPLAEAFGHMWNLANLRINDARIARREQDYATAHREYANGLKLYWNAGYRLVVPRLLTFIADLFAEQNALERAVDILGTIQKCPPTLAETDQVILAMRDDLQAKLEPEKFAAAWERGQGRTLSDLVAELLAEPAGH